MLSASEAIEAIDSTLELIADMEDNYPDIWERGCEFLGDVRKGLRSVRATVLDHRRCSSRQEKAIYNWGRGVRKWHPDHRE